MCLAFIWICLACVCAVMSRRAALRLINRNVSWLNFSFGRQIAGPPSRRSRPGTPCRMGAPVGGWPTVLTVVL